MTTRRNDRPASSYTLRKRLGFTNAEIALLGLDQVPEAESRGYLSKHCYLKLRPAMEESGWRFLVYNKLAAREHYASLGLPLPPFIGLLHPTSGYLHDGSPLRSAHDLADAVRGRGGRGLVVKAVAGRGGDRIRIFDRATGEGPDLRFQAFDGTAIGADELDAWTRQDHRRSGFLESTSGFVVEERLSASSWIQQVAGDAAHSVRVYTLQRDDGTVQVQGAFLRLGRSGVTTDHFSKGGVYAALDLDSGVIGPGAMQGAGTPPRWVDEHPDTLAPFRGSSLPGFDAAKSLSEAAAAATPGLRWMGWDVFLGPDDEPFLLEGNLGWGLAISQFVLGGFVESGVARDWSTVSGWPLPDGSLHSRWRYDLLLRRSRAAGRSLWTLFGKARYLR